ncbi:putative metal-binding motif-containing protein [Candidatus Woesearchaeota archaeon]|nr:putative metal-binding motif-containing protein [Candidatus Woesearchaeota archaeon]
MNQKPILLFVLFLSSISFAAALECSVSQTACNQPGEAIILCLSDQANAHAELPQSIGGVQSCSNYQWKLCCKDMFVSNDCRADNQIAWLAAPTNSHAAQSSGSTYSIPVCVNGLRETTCSTSSFSGSTCVLSFSSKTNAHIASCDESSYKNRVYCAVNSDNDKDGYAANIDCDDDNKNVNPAAEEIGDGLDNDCDGLIDGDDSDLLLLPKGWYQVSTELDKDQFGSYTAEGVEVKTLETGQNVFTLTDSGRKGLLSKKIKIEKGKEYVARGVLSCEGTIQLVFDDTVAEEEESGFLGFLLGVDLVNSATGKDSLSVVANSGEAEYAALFVDVKGENCEVRDLQIDLKGKIQPVEYNDAVQPRSLPIEPTTTFAAAACCPQNTCWNGFSCVENMRDQTFLSEIITEKTVYQCIDGNWVFRAKLYDWNNEEFGSCPNEGQCFVLSSQKDASPEAKASDFYSGKYPLCVNNGEYIFDHYCHEGNWVTRTQLAAEYLLKAAPSTDFTLYCTNPRDALVSLENQDQFVLGDPVGVVSGQAGGLLAVDKPQPTRICFPDLTESGKMLVDDADNTCINNVCLLQDTDGTIAFATTLNEDVNDVTGSFVQALGISPENFAQSCSGEGEYKTCVINGIDGEIYYSPTLNALIYSKDGVSFDPGMFETIISFFTKLFGGAVDETTLIIPANKAVPFIYLSKSGDKSAQAFVEDNGRDAAGNHNLTLVANYSGFKTPICLFVNHLAAPSSAGQGVLGELAGQSGFVCVDKDEIQEIVATKDVGYLWPQLTGRLRVE